MTCGCGRSKFVPANDGRRATWYFRGSMLNVDGNLKRVVLCPRCGDQLCFSPDGGPEVKRIEFGPWRLNAGEAGQIVWLCRSCDQTPENGHSPDCPEVFEVLDADRRGRRCETCGHTWRVPA